MEEDLTKNILFIVGEAGTAKTTKLIQLAEKIYNQGIELICLAFTHSAVHNMAERSKLPKSYFRTLHSFFQISPKDSSLILNKKFKLPPFIFIDEFSLIPLKILLGIFKYGSKSHLIFAGDLLQLNPIERQPKIKSEIFDDIEIKVSFNSALKVGLHLSNNIYSTDIYRMADKKILTENYRSNSNVMQILNNALNNDLKILKPSDQEFLVYVKNKDPVFLASKYSLLSIIYEKVIDKSKYSRTIFTKLGETFYNIGDKFILTKNICKGLQNGDLITIEEEEQFKYNKQLFQLEIEDGELPILPNNFISIHKAQGRGYDNIVVIVDELFEFTMLYTAITRARENVMFISLSKDLDKVKSKIEKSNDAFKILKQLIYNN